MATTLTDRQLEARRCPRHTLDDIVGYEVRRTIIAGEILGYAGPIAERFDRANQYGAAIEAAAAWRTDGDYAVVDSVYACGHTDRDH